MSLHSRKLAAGRDEGGFTLIELVVSIAIGAVVFTALAMMMAGSLRVWAVEKARTVANDVATQAIEDLQRLDDDAAGLCATPSGTVPAGLSNTVILPNCAGAVTIDPCNAPPSATQVVPDEEYTCKPSNSRITYQVKRYVAWKDPNMTEKRLAVFVTWTDAVGTHEVSQQSARDKVAAPRVLSASVSPSTIIGIGLDGTLSTSMTIEAVVSGLTDPATSSDAVRAFFKFRDPGLGPRTTAVRLNWISAGVNGTSTWRITLDPSAYRYPAGTQYFAITATRESDRKEGYGMAAMTSASPPVVTPVTFNCAVGACPSTFPSFGTATVSPSTVDIDANGSLLSNLTVTVNTAPNSVNAGGTVTAFLPTQSGFKTIAMTPTNATNPTQWTVTIPAVEASARGFRFPGGTRNMYFFATRFGTNETTAASNPYPITFQ